jgi:hypothetical protein
MARINRPFLLGCALGLMFLVGTPASAVAWRCQGVTPRKDAASPERLDETGRVSLWNRDGISWGAFSDASSRLDSARAGAPGRLESVWNGSELYVLAYESGSLARLYKYTRWSKATDDLARGFPVDLPLAGSATGVALHQDSEGKLWAAYLSGHDVHVIWSESPDHRSWNTTGIVLASREAAFTTEAALIMHVDGDRIGVVWPDQGLGKFVVRCHRDGDRDTRWSKEKRIEIEAVTGMEFEVIWEDRLSTSQVPASDAQWGRLRDLGIRTIVNLDEVMYDFGRFGFENFLWVRVAPGMPPTRVPPEIFLRFIQLPDNQPAHISSAAPDARATMVALLRYAIDGWSLRRALRAAERLNDGDELSDEQVAWLEDWADRHRPGSHRLRPSQETRDEEEEEEED